MGELDMYDRQGKSGSALLPILSLLVVLVTGFAGWMFWQSQQVPTSRSSLTSEDYVRAVTGNPNYKAVPKGSVQGIVSRSQALPVEQSESESIRVENSESSVKAKPEKVAIVKADPVVRAPLAEKSVKPIEKVAITRVEDVTLVGATALISEGEMESLEKQVVVVPMSVSIPETFVNVQVVVPEIFVENKPVVNEPSRALMNVESYSVSVERAYSTFPEEVKKPVAKRRAKRPSAKRPSAKRCFAARDKLDEVKSQMHTDYETSQYRKLMGLQIKYNRLVARYCL